MMLNIFEKVYLKYTVYIEKLKYVPNETMF